MIENKLHGLNVCQLLGITVCNCLDVSGLQVGDGAAWTVLDSTVGQGQ